MNDQLQQALAAILDKANAGIDAGASFLSAQLPDVIHQLLVWKMVYSLFGMVIAVLVFGGAVWMFKKAYGMPHDDIDWMRPSAFIICLGSAAVCLLCVFVFVSSLDWLEIWLAPKVYLIEYAASLAKGH